MTEYCANCIECLQGVINTDDNEEEDNVEFKKALQSIFLHLSTNSSDLDSEKVKDHQGGIKGDTEDEGDRWKLCTKCSKLLTDLHKLHEEFVQLCKEESIVFQKYVGVTRYISDYNRTNKGGQLVKLESNFENTNNSTLEESKSVVLIEAESVKVELDYEEDNRSESDSYDVNSSAWKSWDPENLDSDLNTEEEGVDSPHFIIVPDKAQKIEMTTTETKRKRGRPKKESYSNSNPEMKEETASGIKRKRGRPRKEISGLSYKEKKRLSKIHRCSQCGTTATSQWNLNLHIQRVHQKLKPFCCRVCPKSFFDKPTLKNHINRFHSNDAATELEDNSEETLIENEESSERNLSEETHELRNVRSRQTQHFYDENQEIEDYDDELEKEGDSSLSSNSSEFKVEMQQQKSVQEKLRKFECHFCLRSFFAKIALKTHIQRFHKNVKKPEGVVDKSTDDDDSPEMNVQQSPPEELSNFEETDSNAKADDVEDKPIQSSSQRKRGRPKKSEADKIKRRKICLSDEPKRGRGRPPKLPFENADGLTYKCPAEGCDKSAKSRWNLNLHVRCVHEKVRKFQCPVCLKKFFAKNAFQIHSKRFHEGSTVASFACPVPGCNRAFAYPAGLHSHSFSHKPKEAMPYTCDVCGSKFRRRCDMATHKAKHSDKRDYICDQCGSSFKTSHNLGKHISSQHAEDKDMLPSTCQICGKILKSVWNLRLHIKCVHENQKPYQCDICGSSFSSSSNLKVHLRGVHSNSTDSNVQNLIPPTTSTSSIETTRRSELNEWMLSSGENEYINPVPPVGVQTNIV